MCVVVFYRSAFFFRQPKFRQPIFGLGRLVALLPLGGGDLGGDDGGGGGDDGGGGDLGGRQPIFLGWGVETFVGC